MTEAAAPNAAVSNGSAANGASGVRGSRPAPSNNQNAPVAKTTETTAAGHLPKGSAGAQRQQPAPYAKEGNYQATQAAQEQQETTTLSGPDAIPTAKRKILRKKQPAPKNYSKIFWITGHVLTLSFGLVFFFLYFVHFRQRRSFVSKTAYRISLLGSVVAYTVTIITKFGLGVPNFGALITTENFQYLLLVVVWFFTRASVFKVLPYVIISFLQLSKHFDLLQKYPEGFTKKLAMVISYNELALILVLLTNTILMRGTSGFALVTFLMFYWLRINYSESTKLFFRDVTETLDERVIKKCPKHIQDEYHKFLKRAEMRSSDVEKIFAAIHESNKKTEAVAKGDVEAGKEQDKPEDRAFATGPKGDEPVDVNISAGEKEPEDNKK